MNSIRLILAAGCWIGWLGTNLHIWLMGLYYLFSLELEATLRSHAGAVGVQGDYWESHFLRLCVVYLAGSR